MFEVFPFVCRSCCRCRSSIGIVSLLAAVEGCALWSNDHWNLDRYRDERAVDIEERLERREPIVKNPF
jgi:hypothetical protein